MKDKNNQVLVMAAGAIIGGILGWLVGMYWLSPGVLIPIGVVIGLAIGLSISRNK